MTTMIINFITSMLLSILTKAIQNKAESGAKQADHNNAVQMQATADAVKAQARTEAAKAQAEAEITKSANESAQITDIRKNGYKG
ncbi:MAG: hypothetical protein LBL61_01440 [Elusimicrobiota bacterium]|nr:hypothetical protein [Elusimicrobiota bacterium]